MIAARLELESFYSITTFIGDISPPPQIRQVAQLTEHYMQPARIKPHAKGAHKQPRGVNHSQGSQSREEPTLKVTEKAMG